MDAVPLIDEFPRLCASLGKARTDRVRNHQTTKQTIGGSRTRWLQNPHQYFLESLQGAYENPDVDDILTGVVRANLDGDTPLSVDRLFVLLACNKRISTDLIMATMKLDQRQARRYMAAARLVIFHLTRADIADTWEIADLIGNPWVEDEQPCHRRTRPVPVRTSPTLAKLRAAHQEVFPVDTTFCSNTSGV